MGAAERVFVEGIDEPLAGTGQGLEGGVTAPVRDVLPTHSLTRRSEGTVFSLLQARRPGCGTRRP